MKQALNAAYIKRTNQRLILDAVFHAGITSRTALAKELRLSKPAISDNLEKLLDCGIVEEVGEGSAGPSGGRRSILLRFNPRHRYIIAVNLNFSNPVFVLSDLNGDTLHAFDVSIPPEASVEEARKVVLAGIRQLLDLSPGRVFSIAVAAPGIFSEDGELRYFSTSCGGPQWWQIDLKTSLVEAFSLPVIVYNDVKAATIGEWRKGTGAGEENLLYLHVGLGIGCGIILNGALLLGENHSAGEIFDYYDAENAHLGQRLEDTICIPYLKQQCLSAARSPFILQEDVSLEEILLAYSREDPAVTLIVDKICRRLAVLTHNYMNFLSLKRVVFGGDYVPFGDCFAKHLHSLFDGSLWPAPEVRMSELGKYAGIQGMVALAQDRYFREICENEWH